jgi:rhamnulose-1-phosphate aldolase
VLASLGETAGLLWQKGWAAANAGNVSCDVTDILAASPAAGSGAEAPFGASYPGLAGRRLLVTAAGTRMRDLAREPDAGCGILQCTGEGAGYHVAWRADPAVPFTPTSELPSHLAIHDALRRRGSPHRAVVHTHPTELLALSRDPALAGEGRLARALRAMAPEMVVAVPGGLAVVPYAMPGTVAQGAAAGAAMERHDVALWAKHGAVAVGRDFADAFDLLDTVNTAARTLLLCRSAGYEPAGLSDAEIEELRRASVRPGGS